jgi:hypothetical protein
MRAEGFGGELLVGGYQHAAYLGAWNLNVIEDRPDGWRITAALVGVNDYWITQRPMRVVLRLGGLEWSWDDVDFDGSIIIVQGRPREGVVVT